MNKITHNNNNVSAEKLNDLDEGQSSVCVYTCCLVFKVHFHQIILQYSYIIYTKKRTLYFQVFFKIFKSFRNL